MSDSAGGADAAAFVATEEELAPGLLLGEYRIEGKLGEGGFGAVYRAVHPVIGKAAAVKVLNRQFSSNAEIVSRFVAEARAVNQIRHRNIIDIFSFGVLPDGRQYYVMELLDGMTLDRYIAREGRLSPEAAVPLLRGVARALDAAHSHGIAHRDLKPENVFVVFDEDGAPSPKLLDFGIAKLMGEGAASHKTRTGVPIGTPFYMSPEQCRGENVDHRTDIYSFGILCHEALCGVLPFQDDSLMGLMLKQTTAPPPPMSQACPAVPAALDAPVLRMLEKDPARRPRSVGEGLEELAAAARRAGFAVEVRSADGTARATPGPEELHSLAHARTLTPAISTGAALSAPRTSRTPLVLAGAAVAIAAVGAAAWALRPRPDAEKAGATTAAAASAPPAVEPSVIAAPGASAEPAPTHVELTVAAVPPDAGVWLGEQRLGAAPGPVRLPRGSAPVTLTVKAPGYQSGSVAVSTTADGVASVTLVKERAVSAPRAPRERPKANPTKELEF